MSVPNLEASATIEPVRQLAFSKDPGVLAIITGIDGPSYRPLGAMMAVFSDGSRVGTLSSGCIEADIAHHAVEALSGGQPKTIRYGTGSPFADIQLPCGGGLDITLVPAPDTSVLRQLCKNHALRRTSVLSIDMVNGALSFVKDGDTCLVGSAFQVRMEPELFFYVFGKGPEAATFAGLVRSAGYPNLLLSPDEETLASARQAGGDVRHLTAPMFPADLSPDAHSAILLFFHDHEWEPPILRHAATTDAFYIGAQGSQRAAASRLFELEQLGLSAADQARIKGPIGLIPSVRDARKLAVSVLADVLNEI